MSDVQQQAQARLDAIEIGRLSGQFEAASRREEGDTKDVRVRRAMAYAAWNFDGRPEKSGHLAEFGVTASSATPSLERPSPTQAKSQPLEEKKPKRRFG